MNDDLYGDNFLKHFGIPGMKWGVRRKRPSGQSRRTAQLQKDLKSFDTPKAASYGKSSSAGQRAALTGGRKGIALELAKSIAKDKKRAEGGGAMAKLRASAKAAISKAKAEKKAEIKNKKLSKAAKNADISKLSNQELREVVLRANLEKRYRATQTSAGKKFAIGALATIGTAVAAKYTTQVIPNAGRYCFGKKFHDCLSFPGRNATYFEGERGKVI